MHLSFLKKKKKKVEWNCGNGIAKMGGKKNLQLWQSQCRKWEGKKMLRPQYFYNIFTINYR